MNDPRDLASRGRLGAFVTHSRYDPEWLTRRARTTFRDSFLNGHGCKVCPRTVLPLGLTEAERRRRGEALRRAHYLRLARRGVASRRRHMNPR
jgi:hypothetical protein